MKTCATIHTGKPWRRFVPALILAMAVLAGCGAAPSTAGEAPPASSAPAASVAAVSASAAPSTAPVVSAAPSASTAAASVSAPPVAASSAAVKPDVPVELQIPAINVKAPVEQVGEDASGAMDVPKKWNDVGWFKLGYRPGEPGNSVIAGHLDSTTDRAVFWNLHLLKPGDLVLVKAADGGQLTFQVQSSATYPYDEAPLQRIFGPASEPMLNLITCDGIFDRATANYSERLVVYTKEVPA